MKNSNKIDIKNTNSENKGNIGTLRGISIIESKMEIRGIKVKDAGQYLCSASSGDVNTSVQKTFNVLVLSKFTKSFFLVFLFIK